MEVKMVSISSIVTPPDRFRDTIDPMELEELRASIANVGLIHPIVLDRDNTLVAGQRRLLAFKLLNATEIPAYYRDELDPLTRRIIEYDENRRRANFTWQEDAKAISEIHELRKAADSSWTYQKTADDLGLSVAKIHSDVELARAIDSSSTILPATSIERVLNRPTRTGALIALKRETETALLRELAKRRSDAVELEPDILFHGPAAGVLAAWEDESVDLIITDPPWLIDVGMSNAVAKQKVMGYEDTNADAVFDGLTQAFRVLKPGHHIYCFVSADNLRQWHEHLHTIGFRTRERPLIWVKEGWHGIADARRRFMTGYDAIIWGYKPDEANSWHDFHNPVMEIASYPPPQSWHAAAKPVELLQSWIRASTVEEDLVLDPFAGSGSTLIAALKEDRQCLGIELDRVTYDQCLKNLNQERGIV